MASRSPTKDIEVVHPPTDSISSLSFSSQADYLAASSWDNTVRIYEVNSTLQTQVKATYSHLGPVLSVCWNSAGDKIFSGGADNIGLMFDAMTGQTQQVAQHEAPIKAVKWVNLQSGLLITGSWDKTVKYWDLRTSNPVASIQLPERLYSMDALFPLMVLGTADRHIQVFNLNNPGTPINTIRSRLNWQTRVVSCCTASSSMAFAMGSVDGKVAIQFVEEKDPTNSYTFKCHRTDAGKAAKNLTTALIYSVNDISFHPTEGTFLTCGSDGSICFWDKDARSRLNTFEPASAPISATAFNRDGGVFAYAISYDWSKGHIGMVPNLPNKIMLHECKDEVKKKPKRI